jgi:major membrane immunogen (membrane-anchored lipoprotein)
MLETIKSLLKAHVAEGKLPPALQAYQDKKNGKKKDDAKDTKEEKVNEAEKRWKQTSMSAAEAEKEYGKSNVKVKKGALRNGDDMVEVFVEGKYKSDAQRKAVHASKAEKANEGETPKFDTMKKYSNTYEAPKEYKMKKEKLEEGLMAQLNALLEADAADAEITMAARGIVDELQDMIEKLGKIQNDQLGPLADEMAYSHGPEQSASFKEATDSAIAGLLGQARSTKDAVNDAVLVLTGQQPASDMAATGAELGGDMGADMEDDISMDMELSGGDESMSGPEDEPLGRAKR